MIIAASTDEIVTRIKDRTVQQSIMDTEFSAGTGSLPKAFVDMAGIELNRAERYSVFVSLTVLDLDFAREYIGGQFSEAMTRISKSVRTKIRACDYASVLGDHSLAVLLPETSRQGAEIATRRLTELVRDQVSEMTGQSVSEVVPVEMASYPDTAGTKTLSALIQDMVEQNKN